MMRLVALLISVVLLLGGCAPTWSRPAQGTQGRSGVIRVCVDLPQERIPAAAEAIKLWDAALWQWKRVEMFPAGSPGCSVTVREEHGPFEEDDTALAWTSMLGGSEIWMRKGRYEGDVTGILLHELGHAFGAQHVGGTLMNPTWHRDQFVCPDSWTVIQVAAWNHVDLRLLSWCHP